MKQEVICMQGKCLDMTHKECDEIFEDELDKVECEFLKRV